MYRLYVVYVCMFVYVYCVLCIVYCVLCFVYCVCVCVCVSKHTNFISQGLGWHWAPSPSEERLGGQFFDDVIAFSGLGPSRLGKILPPRPPLSIMLMLIYLLYIDFVTVEFRYGGDFADADVEADSLRSDRIPHAEGRRIFRLSRNGFLSPPQEIDHS